MTIVYVTLLNLIISFLLVYGVTEDCIPVNKLLNKEQTSNCCFEETIFCEKGHIYAIYLNFSLLKGSIPPELGNLSELQTLFLEGNELTGSIPKEFEKLSKLEHLNINNNKLNGTIPSELGKLSNLKYLHLGNNNLSGSIPKELGDLTQLKELTLEYNNLSGSIPKELEKLTQLEYFYIRSNDFCGDVPNFSKCKIDMAGNQNLGYKCPDNVIEQNNGSNKESSKDNETQNNNDGGGSQTMLFVIIGVLALLIVLIILAYFIKKNKNDKTVKTNNEFKIKTQPSDMDHSNVTEEVLPLYTFLEDYYFEWKIEDWNQLKDKEYSTIFVAHDYLWKLILIKNSFNQNNEESVDVGLTLCEEIDNNEFIYANFIVYFRNYNNNQVYKEVEYDDKPTFYSAKSLNHGINDAILKSELYYKMNDGCSILENNKIIIGVLVKFYSI